MTSRTSKTKAELRYTGSTSIGDIVQTAATQTEVHAVYTIAGDPDALVQIRVRDLPHLQDVVDRLRRGGQSPARRR